MVPPTVLFSHGGPDFAAATNLLCGLALLGILLVALGFALWARWDDVARRYSSICRRFSENPRFGIFALLEAVFDCAVFLALVQWIGNLRGPGIAIALLAAVAIVGVIHLVLGDAVELSTRPAKSGDSQPVDPRDEHAEQHRPKIGPPPEAEEPGRESSEDEAD